MADAEAHTPPAPTGRILTPVELDDPPEAGPEALAEEAERLAPEPFANWLAWLTDYPAAQTLVALAAVLLVAVLAHFVTRLALLRVIGIGLQRIPRRWGDHLVTHKVFDRLAPIVPAVVINRGVVFTPHVSDEFIVFIQRVAMAAIVLVAFRSLGALLTAINTIYSSYPISRGRPIKGYIQVLKIAAYFAAGVFIVAILAGQSPWYFVSGLGAMTAIILLIFRETILSLVAGMQLVNNDLVRVGDWISMPQFEADGDVTDIALNFVKVKNWDNTVTIIPAHKFLDHSFRNWRSMHESGGRRIMRSIHIDMTTIRFLTDAEADRFERFLILRDYIRGKTREIERYNREHCPDDVADIVANERHLTNVGTFRAYVVEYLRRHPKIHQGDGFPFLIRQLAPTPHGLPLEIYVFVNDTAWANYEGIQADIFDHFLAVLPEFDLRVFQEPGGADLTRLGQRLRAASPPAASPAASNNH